MESIRVCCAQLCVRDDIAENVRSINGAIDFAAGQQADILLTPEGSLSGYTNRFDQKAVEKALPDILARARKTGLGLALGTCFYETEKECYNQIRFYDKDGRYLGFHSKILRCGGMEPPNSGEIDYYATTPLKVFDFHGITVGGLICNDMWANPGCTPMPDPHLSQQLSRLGAKIIFHAVNGGRSADEFSQVVCRGFHEGNLRIRAAAGRVWICVADNAYPETVPNSCSGGVIMPDGSWAVKMETQGVRYCAYTIKL